MQGSKRCADGSASFGSEEEEGDDWRGDWELNDAAKAAQAEEHAASARNSKSSDAS